MKHKTTCPICEFKEAFIEESRDDIQGYPQLVEWHVFCPKCKFEEHWAYGNWCGFNKPKLRWKWRKKFKNYVKECLEDE